MTDVEVSPVIRCFVIGPIGNKFASIGTPERESYEEALDVFEKVILPACQSFSIEPVRADQIALTGEITEQVFRHLFDDEIVIADVSGGNPNVMYELGLRHTRPLLTIQLGEYGQLPFDVSAVRTIQFSRSDRGLIDARKALEKALHAGLTDPGDGVTATRIWKVDGTPFEAAHSGHDELVPPEYAAEDLDSEGFLDRLQVFEETMPSLNETTEDISAVVAEMGSIASSSSAEINDLNAASAPMTQRLAYVAKFASALQPSADELTTLTNKFYVDMSEIDKQLRGIFDYLGRNPSMLANADVNQFLGSIGGMTRSSREAMENMSQFDAAMDGLAGMSRVLRKPARQIGDAVRTMLKAILLTDAWDDMAAAAQQRFNSAVERQSPSAPYMADEIAPRSHNGRPALWVAVVSGPPRIPYAAHAHIVCDPTARRAAVESVRVDWSVQGEEATTTLLRGLWLQAIAKLALARGVRIDDDLRERETHELFPARLEGGQ